MKDDRTARLLQLLTVAGSEGQSAFPGGRPGLICWLGQQLDAHPGDAGHQRVEDLLQRELQRNAESIAKPQALTADEIESLRHDAQLAGQQMKAELDRQKR
ncbi:hypothetical protein PVE_R2G0914 [Pseudomonas veronii 1YdBTEX2]|nr:hypothetical protein PVE_R2G0914 [Pseudomonas veronii 1YdBTEX2]